MVCVGHGYDVVCVGHGGFKIIDKVPQVNTLELGEVLFFFEIRKTIILN